MRRAAAAVEPTTLGPPLRRRDDRWVIDLTELPLFHGLSVLSRALGEQVVERCHGDSAAIVVERRVKASENPELAAMGCAGVTLHAEREVLAHVPDDVEGFQHELRAVFGTLQQARWRRHVLPDDDATPPRALVFHFPGDERVVLDRVPAPQGSRRFFLRLAVERVCGRRLDLAAIPHVVVDDLEHREYIAGSTRIAQTLRDVVHREAERGRRHHLERRKRGSFVFAQLERGGLGGLAAIHVAWSERFAGWLATAEPSRLDHALKRVLLLLEDAAVRRLLHAGDTVELTDGGVQAFLDLSQERRVLNVAFEQPRRRADLDAYLARMPALAAVAAGGAAAQPLAGLSCILIHHVTSEVLGLIAALRALGCDDLDVLFVRYAGEIPHDYLDAVLDGDRCVRSWTLQHVDEPGVVEGRFVLSQQLSPLDDVERVAERLRTRPTRYLEAMVAVAVRLFVRALASGRPILVVEDGGYLVPALTRAAAAGDAVGALAAAHDAGPVPRGLAERPLRALLAERLLGSVEHTRNGFDRLAALEREHGLVRPAYSIAVSRLKVEDEAREVAAGILTAVEAVLHARGAVLSRRRPAVLGARGAIGRHLVAALRAGRLDGGDVLEIDLAVGRRTATAAARWSELPERRRRIVDLLLGVTGVAALDGAAVDELLLHGEAPVVLFASGSTKTIEFRAAADRVDALLGAARPRLGGHPVAIERAEVVDPQSGRLYGTAFTLHLGRGAGTRTRTLVFVANLTPVNFLFYAVPTEAMDGVMAQLLQTTLALVRDARGRQPPAPGLYAVDRDIPAASLPGGASPRRRGRVATAAPHRRASRAPGQGRGRNA